MRPAATRYETMDNHHYSTLHLRRMEYCNKSYVSAHVAIPLTLMVFDYSKCRPGDSLLRLSFYNGQWAIVSFPSSENCGPPKDDLAMAHSSRMPVRNPITIFETIVPATRNIRDSFTPPSCPPTPALFSTYLRARQSIYLRCWARVSPKPFILTSFVFRKSIQRKCNGRW